MEPLISVIVPVYKVEQYLARCIDSLLNQTYRNLEIILVNDGSPDKSGEICDTYKIKDSRVVVIHKPNGGPSDARNQGIDIAKGDYLAFVDADDWLPLYHFSKMYHMLAQHNADIVAGNFMRTTDSAAQFPPMQPTIYEFTNIEALEKYLTPSEFYTPLVIPCCKIYKRDIFREIRYPVGKLHEDELTTHKLLYLAKKIVYTNEYLYFYYQRSDSTMGRGFDIQKRLYVLEAFDERATFFKQIGLQANYEQLVRRWFLNAFNIDHHLTKYPNPKVVAELQAMRQGYLAKLRGCNFTLRFRLFYELYYLCPKPFAYLYNLVKGQ